MDDNELLFVKLKNPVELRRGVLETARDVIELLQRYEKFKNIKEERTQRTNELATTIREINKLFNKMKSKLPKTQIRIEGEQEKVPEKVEKQPIAKKRARSIKVQAAPMLRPLTELDKLEAELKDIESKIEKIK